MTISSISSYSYFPFLSDTDSARCDDVDDLFYADQAGNKIPTERITLAHIKAVDAISVEKTQQLLCWLGLTPQTNPTHAQFLEVVRARETKLLDVVSFDDIRRLVRCHRLMPVFSQLGSSDEEFLRQSVDSVQDCSLNLEVIKTRLDLIEENSPSLIAYADMESKPLNLAQLRNLTGNKINAMLLKDRLNGIACVLLSSEQLDSISFETLSNMQIQRLLYDPSVYGISAKRLSHLSLTKIDYLFKERVHILLPFLREKAFRYVKMEFLSDLQMYQIFSSEKSKNIRYLNPKNVAEHIGRIPLNLLKFLTPELIKELPCKKMTEQQLHYTFSIECLGFDESREKLFFLNGKQLNDCINRLGCQQLRLLALYQMPLIDFSQVGNAMYDFLFPPFAYNRVDWSVGYTHEQIEQIIADRKRTCVERIYSLTSEQKKIIAPKVAEEVRWLIEPPSIRSQSCTSEVKDESNFIWPSGSGQESSWQIASRARSS